MKIRREEEKNYEKNIIDKCKNEPKLFYRYVNSKMKCKSGISKLKLGGNSYEGTKEMAEIMNRNFQKVFTVESEFMEGATTNREQVLHNINVEVREINKLLGNLDVRKAPGPDGISNWILRECKEQLADKIHKLIVCSLVEGTVPLDWKRANIVPIHK